jgi:hypothetical protein
MALSKTQILDRVESVSQGDWYVVQVRYATVVSEDGVELSRSYQRTAYDPTGNWSEAEPEVQALCNAVHTADRIQAYTAAMTPVAELDDTQA